MEQQRGRAKQFELWLYLAGVFGITWGIAALLLAAPDLLESVFGEFSTSSPVYFVAVFAPAITALALTAIFRGRSGLLRLLAMLRPRLAGAPYYLLVLLGWPVMDAAALFAQVQISGEAVPTLDFRQFYLAPGFLLMRLVTDAGPLGEELGWRGYALPRLLERLGSSLVAALILGVIWGVWHLPAFLISGTYQHDLGMGVLWLIVGTMLLTIIMTWLFRQTGGDILAAGLLVHLMNNVMLAKLPYVALIYTPFALLAAIALVRGDRKRAAQSA